MIRKNEAARVAAHAWLEIKLREAYALREQCLSARYMMVALAADPIGSREWSIAGIEAFSYLERIGARTR